MNSTISAINKVVNPGRVMVGRQNANVFCRIKISYNGRLSITGVVGPLRSGKCRGSCGQIADELVDPTLKLNKGWNPELVKSFLGVWERWHLNDMRAGTPAQEDFLRPLGLSGYGDMCEALKEAGLYTVEHEGMPYRYGQGWLKEELPPHIRAFLASLPDSKITPAWV